jgi:putative transcriptional regulator
MTRLEFIRRNLGLSQVELAGRVGIHPTAIVQVERGHRKPWPSFRKLIAAELGVLEEELFNTNGWPIEKI